MPDEHDLQHSELDQASAQLNEGLKSCRAVVRDYRAMLSGESGYQETVSNGDDAVSAEL